MRYGIVRFAFGIIAPDDEMSAFGLALIAEQTMAFDTHFIASTDLSGQHSFESHVCGL